MIAPNVVATARHCVADNETFFWHSGVELEVKAMRLHPSADLALLRTDARCTQLAPGLSLEEETPVVGAPAWISGYGKTETGFGGELRLAMSQIMRTDEAYIVVSSNGVSGACVGDSGGPLLSGPSDDPSAGILGILSIGSGDCLGEDFYVRLDVIREWLRANMQALQ